MAKGGRKYRLLMYEYMLNRWWPVTLLMSIFIFINVGSLWAAEWYFGVNESPLPKLSETGGWVLLVVGCICFIFTLFLLVTRKMAHIQLFDDHLRILTPFFRMNMSYKRILRTTSTQMYSLFPPKSLSSWKRDLIEPIAGNTVIVLYLTSYPLSRMILGLFLSPFFFYDKSTHLVLCIEDWIHFNLELDSRRVGGKNMVQGPAQQKPAPVRKSASGLLDDLKRK